MAKAQDVQATHTVSRIIAGGRGGFFCFMRTDEAGIEFIRQQEGVELQVYADPIGLLTVGVGHLVTARDGLNLGDTITEQQADAFLRADLQVAERAVSELVKVKITQAQFNALVSLIFNIGRARFAASTLLRLLNRGDYDGAAAQFEKWVNAGGRKFPGLVNRRKAERALFEKG